MVRIYAVRFSCALIAQEKPLAILKPVPITNYFFAPTNRARVVAFCADHHLLNRNELVSP